MSFCFIVSERWHPPYLHRASPMDALKNEIAAAQAGTHRWAPHGPFRDDRQHAGIAQEHPSTTALLPDGESLPPPPGASLAPGTPGRAKIGRA